MPLSDWLEALSRRPRSVCRDPSRKRQVRRKAKVLAGAEALEDRRVLATTIFLDFGLGLPAAGLEVTAKDFRDIAGFDTGTDLIGDGPDGNKLLATDKIKLKPLDYNYDGGPFNTKSDIGKLQTQILPIVTRALQPFDIEVQLARATSLDDVRQSLKANNKSTTGKNDAYVFLATVTADKFSAHNGSVGANTKALGEAAGKDLARGFNGADEAVLVYTDRVLNSLGGTAEDHGTAEFNERLAFQLAATALHEAAHTFGLSHLQQDGVEGQLAHGDFIKERTNPDAHNIFTRFELQLESDTTKYVSNYAKLAGDSDIGLRDSNRNGKPEFAYVTGTGAHDRIKLVKDATNANLIKVTVDAYSDRVDGTFVRRHEYEINLSNTAELGIRIDASQGNDSIEVDASITTLMLIYGGDGNDTIHGGGGVDEIHGEGGADTIFGHNGDDTIFGGDDRDTIEGGPGKNRLAGNDGVDTIHGGNEKDYIHGGKGGDFLFGEGGPDTIIGGSGGDTIRGGSEDDEIRGEAGHDTIHGDAGADEIWNYDGDNVTNDGHDIIHLKPPASSGQSSSTSSFMAPSGVSFAMAPQSASASGPLSQAQAAAIVAGLPQLAGWAQSAGGTLPVGDGTAGAALQDILTRGLVAKVQEYFNANTSPTIEGLVAALQQLNDVMVGDGLFMSIDPATVKAILEGNATRFELRFAATRTKGTSLANLGAKTQGVEGVADSGVEVPLTTKVDFNLSFGVDLGPGGQGQDLFFVQLPAAGITVQSNIDAAELELPMYVGLLQAQTDDGAVFLDVDTTLTLNGADTDGDSRLRLSELTAAEVNANPTGVVYANLPFAAQAGGYLDHGAVTILNNDLAQSPSSQVAIAGSETIEKFTGISPFVIVQYLNELALWLESVDDAEVLAAEIPFTSGMTVGEIVDFAHTFRTQVLALLIDNNGQPTFHTAQELANVLLSSLDVGSFVVGLDYDSATQELTWRLDVSYAATHHVPLAFDLDLGSVVDVQVGSPQSPNPSLNLLARISGSMLFGINLGSSTSDFQFNGATLLSALNDGEGVTIHASAPDLEFTLTNGSTFTVDFQNEQTVAEVAATIEAASGGKVDVTIDESGRRLRLVQHSSVAAGGSFQVKAINGSVAGAGLGILDENENTSGVIEGAPLDGSSLLDRFFIREATLAADLSAKIDDFDASARLGIFNVALVDGQGSFDLGVSLTATNITASLDQVTFTPEISGSASLDLPLTANIAGVSLANTRVRVNWADITDPATFNPEIVGNVDLTGALEAVAMQYIIDALQYVVGFLQGVQQTSVFQTEIPVLNRSLADLLDTSQKLDALAQELEQNPPTTIDEAVARIHALLGSAAVAFNNGILELDLGYALATSHAFNLAFDLDDSLGGVLEQFVDLSANAPIEVSASANATLGLGIDINGGSPEFFLKNTSGISLAAMVESTGIALDAAIGPLGVFIRDGVVRLDNGTPGQSATWTLSLANGPSRIGLEDLLDFQSLVDMTAVGRVDATLPVFFPRPDVPQGEIVLTVANLNDIGGTTTLAMPDFAAAIANLDISDLLGTTIDGWDGVIRLLQDALDGEVLGMKLPLIGDKLAEVSGFLDAMRADVIDRLESAQHLTAEAVQQALFDALRPWLVDRPGDSDTLVTREDVIVQLREDGFGVVEEIDFQFDLAGVYNLGSSIDFDLGLDGLGLDLDGNVDLSVTFQMSVGFGLSRSEGFYLHSDAAPELSIDLIATLPGAAATANLGLLQLMASDVAADPTHFTATLSVDLLDPDDDGRLTLAEITGASSVSDVVAARLSGEAEINLHLVASLAHPALPSLEADFHLLWLFDTNDPSLAGEIQSLGFSDVKINLGTFVTNIVEPVLSKVRSALEPVKPVIEALTKRVPVISDLAGRDITLLDLAEQFGFVSASTHDFIEDVTSLANDLPDYAGYIHLGDLMLDADAARSGANLGKLQPAAPVPPPIATELAKVRDIEDRSGFSIPLLNDPAKAFGLLLGRDMVLISYDMPRLEFEFDYRKFFPVIGPLGVTLAGEVGAMADFSFGYDTRGLRQFVAGDFQDPAVLANGFFVSDLGVDGTDVREVEFFGGLAAYAAVSVAVAEIGVGGGLSATISLDLNDPDRDGKVYWQEIVGQLEQGSLVNVSGELTAFLKAYLTIDFGLFSSTWEKNFAKTELASFSYNPAPGATPVLGSVDASGELRLNIGPRAGERLIGDTNDGHEHFEIAPGSVAGQVIVKFFSTNGLVTQTFDNISRIVGDGGAGNDTIIISPDVTAEVELRGGIGNDTLTAGGGLAKLLGGDGNDMLTAGSAAATLEGGAGNDTLLGGSQADTLSGGDGNDTLRGGAGNDTLNGGKGNDTLDGQANDDTLEGGNGDDTLLGGDHADTLSGGRGRDTLDGQAGNDILSGGDDDDTLRGGAGNDLLQGDDGDDELWGGDHDDMLEGGSGDDKLFGEAGVDALFASIGADFLDGGDDDDVLHGGTGADELHGGLGIDQLFGDDGPDILFGELDNDFLFGGADADLLFGGGDDDTLRGGDGNDILVGGQGNDVLEGEAGSDVIDGQSGEDRIQFAVTLLDVSGSDSLTGGPHRDMIEIVGTDQADDLRVEQIGMGTFRVERRDPLSGTVTATFQFTLPADPLDRDIELLRVSGAKGDDTIRAIGNFNVNQIQLYGGDDNDRLEGSAGDDMLFGGKGNDTLLGHAGHDELHGGDGNDTLDGGAGNDALYGEAGDDTINGGEGADVAYGGADNDTIEAGPGILGDIMFGDDDAGAVGSDTLIGGDGVDVMFGGPGNDRLEGRGSMDLLHGEAGIDTLLGGTGRDFLSGGTEDDFLYATSDNAATEATPSGTWLEIYVGLHNRQTAILNEMIAIDAFMTANPADPSLPELQAKYQRLADELAAIDVAKLDINLYQTVLVDILIGDAGNDWLQGSAYNDRLIGGSGNDIIVHTTGADIVFGGTDPLSGDTTDGMTESDEYRVRGTENADTIAIRLDVEGQNNPKVFVVVNGLATQASHQGIEVAGVEALGGDDAITVLFGSNAAMKVNISGGDGNDTIDASTFQSDAVISGGAGNDTILGGLGNDTLNGDGGNDILTGGRGLDALDGGDGIDQLKESVAGTVYLNHVILYLYPFGTLIYDSFGVQEGSDSVWERVFRVENAHLTGSDGPDSINTSTFLGNVTLLGRGGRDTLIAGVGNDTIDGGADDDTITGGFGNDTLIGGEGIWDQLVEEANVNMTLNSVQLIGLGTDSHSGFELAKLTGGVGHNILDARGAALQATLNGGEGNDTLHGTNQADTLMGGSGHDTLYGWGGDDSMGGEADNDWMYGGEGNDVMFGHGGLDTLYGAGGDDLMVGGQGNDRLYGEGGNDSIAGDDIWLLGPPPTTGGDDYIDGGSGDDQLYGSFGNDTILGGSGNDKLYGDNGNDTLRGGDGDDKLYGGIGTDWLYGDAHNDFLDGGNDSVKDYLYGGTGADEFMNYYRVTHVWVKWYWVTKTVYEEFIGDFNAADGDWKTNVQS